MNQVGILPFPMFPPVNSEPYLRRHGHRWYRCLVLLLGNAASKRCIITNLPRAACKAILESFVGLRHDALTRLRWWRR